MRRSLAGVPLACVVSLVGSVGYAAQLGVPVPFTTIQAAINAAVPGVDEVVVQPGHYDENLDFGGRNVTVRSTNPDDPAVVAATVIDGNDAGPVALFISGETASARLTGFTLTNGSGYPSAPGITLGGGVCCRPGSPTIEKNVISGNSATTGGGLYVGGGSPVVRRNRILENHADGRGGGVFWAATPPTVQQCTIAGNSADVSGGGLYLDGSPAAVRGCVVSGNTAGASGGGLYLANASSALIVGDTISGNGAPDGGGLYCDASYPTVSNTIIAFSTAGGGLTAGALSFPSVSYCNAWQNTGGDYVGFTPGGAGNLTADPLFADRAAGDFLLKSRGGRWTPGGWVVDDVHSPCIGAGDPGSAYGLEPEPNGRRVNMGAEGNTAQASRSFLRPDMMVRKAGEVDYAGDGVYNTTGAGQARTWTVRRSVRAVFQLRFQNDGTGSGRFRIRGPAGSARWQVRYFSKLAGGADITPEVTGAGWATPWRGPGAVYDLRAEVTPLVGAGGNEKRPLLVLATPEGGPAYQDAVRAVTTCSPDYRPDMLIRNAGEGASIGDGIYNGTAADQTKSQDVAPDQQVGFWLTAQNDGNVRQALRITGRAGSAAWAVRYFDAWLQGQEITAGVTGAGWDTPLLAPGEIKKLRVVAQRRPGVEAVSALAVAAKATSTLDGTKRDVVKAVATPIGSGGAARLSGVAVTAAGAGAEISFSLTAAAEVECEVLNLAGRPVRTVCRAQRCEAGATRLLWDARSDGGLRAPNGQYLVRLLARADDGTESRALASLRINR